MRWKPLLLFALVHAALVCAAEIPTPKSHFGHEIGVDKVLLDWDQVVSYFYKLEESSDRLRVKEIGKTAYRQAVYRGHDCVAGNDEESG